MRYETVTVKESVGLDPTALSPAKPREKWLRKRTQVKLRVRARWPPGAGARGPGLQGRLVGGGDAGSGGVAGGPASVGVT